ncbi:MAG TPA: hypothetical protein VMR33_16405 [Candidatus Baltobacteraceae bacterium]|jgi:hypothetical protein|nr:hypothetical protein [Candidatus Baltobacteraceae bacterium]
MTTIDHKPAHDHSVSDSCSQARPFSSAAVLEPNNRLLETIISIHGSVGDGLNDDEFTRLLQKIPLPVEAEFAFLSYSDRFVTLMVRPQELRNWYPEKRWITEEKERLARQIAKKYDLSLCEPPDARYTCLDSPNPHHHLELTNRRETIIVAHPKYLKIRIFQTTSTFRFAQVAQWALSLGPDLLQDLSELYLPANRLKHDV